MEKRRVVIAGITGYLGSRLAHWFVNLPDYQVAGICRKSSSLRRLAGITSQVTLFDGRNETLEDWYAEGKFDVAVNCITNYGRGSSIEDVIEANLQFPVTLFELACENQTQLFLNAGTSLPRDVNAYSLSKNQFSEWMNLSSNKMAAIDTKLEHFYGPGEDSARFIRFLIEKFLSNVSTLDLTEGKQQRDFLYIEDVLSAFECLIESGLSWDKGYYAVPVGSGEAPLLRNVVELVQEYCENTETELRFGAVPYREREVMHSQADIQQLMQLGWQPKWNLSTGLKRTVEFYRKQDTTRKIA